MAQHTALSLRVEADNVMCIDGLIHERRSTAAPAPARRVATAVSDPFPQVLDTSADHLVASLPQVPADSKPKLGETFGVLTSGMRPN